MAPPGGRPVNGDDVGLSQRDLIMEIREDVKALTKTVEAIARDHALGADRAANMQLHCNTQVARIEQRDREQDIAMDDMRQWRDRADGAFVLARWALGASLVSLTAVALQIFQAFLP